MSSSVSQTRLEEIKAIVGSPAQGGPVAYYERLKNETDKDGSLSQYLSWSIENRPSLNIPQYAPKDILGMICGTNYTDPQSLISLRTRLSFSVIDSIELAKDSNESFVIASDPEAVAPAYEPPHTVMAKEEERGDLLVHPGLVGLTTTIAQAVSPGIAASRATETAATPKMPAIVLPIGRLLHKDDRPIEDFGDTEVERSPDLRDYEETNYVVVVDVLQPEHPIWLIYNHYPVSELGEREFVDHSQECNAFQDIGSSFDSAQLFTNAKDWYEQYNEVSLERLKELIKSTMATGAVEFSIVKVDDATNSFNKAMAAETSRAE